MIPLAVLVVSVVAPLTVRGQFIVQADQENDPAPTPVTVEVTPVVVPVAPAEEVVAPIGGTAEADTGPVEQSLGAAGDPSSSLFTGVRGGLIAAAIAAGALAAGAALLAGVRLGLRRIRG